MGTLSRPFLVCRFRERFSDFVVHEIGLDGKVAELTDESLPALETNEVTETDPDVAISELVATTDLSVSESQSLKHMIRRLLDEPHLPPVLLPATSDKELRRRQHEVVTRRLPKLVTDTAGGAGEAKSVRIFSGWQGDMRKRGREDELDVRSQWPRGKPKDVRFALYKENVDTMTVASQLGRALRCGRVGYAGTKDRRAVTTQWVTVSNVLPSTIFQRTKSMRKWCRIGNASFVASPIELGDLNGNQFEVALRQVPTHVREADVDAACAAVSASGFCNYFGLQRFGIGATNAQIGTAALCADWRRCVELVLAPNSFDDTSTKRAKAAFRRGDIALAQAAMPRRQRTERAVLESLARQPYDFSRAFHSAISKNLRLMFLHAHQSFVWNALATERLRRHGPSKVVLGDLVLPHHADLAAGAPVKIVGAHDLASYSPFDVVLPLPGNAVTYPIFDGAQVALQASGALDRSSYASENRRAYNLSGAYRRLLARPKNLTWRLVRYQSKEDQLIETDLDRLASKDDRGEKKLRTTEDVCDTPPAAALTAILLSFELRPSSYATCCLREITKSSMSKGFHADRTKVAATMPPANTQEAAL